MKPIPIVRPSPPTKPCWYCGADPRRQTRYMIGVEWIGYACCTAGQSTPHEANAIDSWNGLQTAQELQKALAMLTWDSAIALIVGHLDNGTPAANLTRANGEIIEETTGETPAAAIIALAERMRPK